MKTWAEALYQRCGDHIGDGEYRRAESACTLAIEEAQRTGNRALEAAALNLSGQAVHAQGHYQPALALYSQAVSAADEAGAADVVASGRHNLGVLFGSLGRYEEAAQQLRRAAEEQPPGLGQATSWLVLGQMLEQAGPLEDALAANSHATESFSSLNRPVETALAHNSRGSLLTAHGRFDEALVEHRHARRLIEPLNSAPAEALVELSLGKLYEAMGNCQAALLHLDQAFGVHLEQENQAAVIEGLPVRARCLAHLGKLDEAEALVDDALSRFESMRTALQRTSLRSDFLGSRFGLFGTAVELAMARHRIAPGAGHDRRAFDYAERARARTLVDRRLAGEQTLARALSSEESALRQQLGEYENRRFLRQQEGRPVDLDLERELEQLYMQLEGQPVELPAAETVPTLVEIQWELLDQETVLLSFALGSERSYLWWVEEDQLQVFELPPASQIDPLARRVHALLSKPTVGPERELLQSSLKRLGERLLAPVADRLQGQRLLIVADAALHYVPFDALTDPRTGNHLVSNHEIVHLPAASFLAAQRRRLANREPVEGALAALGDSIFDLSDSRLDQSSHAVSPAAATAPPATRALQLLVSGSLRRLQYTGVEVEGITSIESFKGEVLLATGARASRSLLLNGDLGRFRIVHLATHGRLDDRHPERSGLVLSLFDEDGQPIDGLVQAHEIQQLDLPAELVVLSACETALGKEVRGEGLMGLSHAFFQAGAARLVVSFWQVPDRSTAELMRLFYFSLSTPGTSPATALREAKLKMIDLGYSEHQWASMALFGDWLAF